MAGAAAPPRWNGEALHNLITEFYPIRRSITGPGVRETLTRVGSCIPLSIGSVPSGTKVFDWIVPQEWTLRDAWIRDGVGRTVVDVRQHTLHVPRVQHTG